MMMILVWRREHGDGDDDCQVLVVVDGPMVRYHGKGVRHYVLTLMHIVSSPIIHGVSFS